MANIVGVRGSERKTTHAPRSPRGVIARLWTVARLLLGVTAIAAIGAPVIVDSESMAPAPGLRLVDDGGSNAETDPPYHPTPTPTPTSTPDPDRTRHPNDAPPADSDDDSGGVLLDIPVAAQTGISLGVIGLAAVALIPGRRPPSALRG